MIGYGAMVVESLLGIVALVVVGAVAVNGSAPEGTPFAIFSTGVAGFLEKFGVPVHVATVFMTMCVSALALTSLDSVARIGRMSFQELFYLDTTDPSEMKPWRRLLTNKYFATVITLFFGYLLTLGGYNNVWPLFGSANQLLAALVLIALAVFLKTTGRTGWTLYAPMFIMLAVTFTALVQKIRLGYYAPAVYHRNIQFRHRNHHHPTRGFRVADLYPGTGVYGVSAPRSAILRHYRPLLCDGNAVDTPAEECATTVGGVPFRQSEAAVPLYGRKGPSCVVRGP